MSSLELDRAGHGGGNSFEGFLNGRRTESLICLYALLITHGWLGSSLQRVEGKHTSGPAALMAARCYPD